VKLSGRSRISGVTLSVFATSAVAAWALAHAAGTLATTVALAGIAGVMTFAVALTAPFARVRSRSIGLTTSSTARESSAGAQRGCSASP
jgi:uncharacterized YccA/Bax inhibitor family protein